MTAIKLDGKRYREEIFADLKARVKALGENYGVTPGSVSYTHLTLPTKA